MLITLKNGQTVASQNVRRVYMGIECAESYGWLQSSVVVEVRVPDYDNCYHLENIYVGCESSLATLCYMKELVQQLWGVKERSCGQQKNGGAGRRRTFVSAALRNFRARSGWTDASRAGQFRED